MNILHILKPLCIHSLAQNSNSNCLLSQTNIPMTIAIISTHKDYSVL